MRIGFKELNKILRNLYETELFENVVVRIDNSILKINVSEYQSISSLKINGEKSTRFLTELKRIIKLKEKKSFIKSYLSNDIETIKNFYSSLGFNTVKVNAKIEELKENQINLLIEIDKGNKTKISSIIFVGDKKIKDKRLRDIIASEEDKFWKVLTRNTNFSQNLIDLDIRLLQNYYKSRV